MLLYLSNLFGGDVVEVDFRASSERTFSLSSLPVFRRKKKVKRVVQTGQCNILRLLMFLLSIFPFACLNLYEELSNGE